jgi:hypothetical protein
VAVAVQVRAVDEVQVRAAVDAAPVRVVDEVQVRAVDEVQVRAVDAVWVVVVVHLVPAASVSAPIAAQRHHINRVYLVLNKTARNVARK